jgi:hypothetical protein
VPFDGENMPKLTNRTASQNVRICSRRVEIDVSAYLNASQRIWLSSRVVDKAGDFGAGHR